MEMARDAEGVTGSRDLIQLRGVSKTFEVRGSSTPALLPVSLDVRRHEFVGIVGPSGCGKSTILNILSGLMQPTSGVALYDGSPVTGPNMNVGYMTQKDTLLPWRTVADNVMLSLELRCRNVPDKEARERAADMIGTVGLRGFEKHYPNELSGGMRKRAALARTLIYEPETLLMDEPFGALDAQLKLVMLHELQRLAEIHKTTVLFVTHDLGEASTLSDRVVVIGGRPGRIKVVKEVPFPKPRNVYEIRFSTEFAKLNEELWALLRDDVIGEGAT